MITQPGRRIPSRSNAFSSIRRATTVYWPVPVDVRLDQLVDEVATQGVTVSRSELLAALVATTPPDAAALLERYRAYRELDVGAVAGIAGAYLRLRPKRPGRRRLGDV